MKLVDLQKKIAQSGLDCYWVCYGNRFIGQDILLKEHKLKHLCGFSGSAGALLVTTNKAFLFVDGRYELQARLETDSEKVMVIDKVPTIRNIAEFLHENNLNKVGYDAWCFSVADKDNYLEGLEFSDVGDWFNLDNDEQIDLFSRDVKFSGRSRENKCEFVTYIMEKENADYCLITASDSVSWLLNLYAKDLPYSPVVRAYVLLDKNGKIKLFGNCKFANDNLKDVSIINWQDMPKVLAELENVRVLYDDKYTPIKLIKLFSDKNDLVKVPDICQMCKQHKNKVELQGMINCHVRDGVAVVKLLAWLEDNWRGKTELDVVNKLHEFREQQKYFFSESFETIAGSAENGAIVHYNPTKDNYSPLKENNLLLLDSGGQYLDGTTDITRTIALGEPSEDMKNDFTYVLKAHIALAQARFLENTKGAQLDVLARQQLWQRGLDYKHGTGHGVACFGNVHEMPVSISSGATSYNFGKNVVTSIEPGCYKKNAYGIRIENLVYTAEVDEFADKLNLLEFKLLTLVPIDKKLINAYLLSKGEQDWLNSYHRMVFERLAAFVNENEKKWMEKSCSPI